MVERHDWRQDFDEERRITLPIGEKLLTKRRKVLDISRIAQI